MSEIKSFVSSHPIDNLTRASSIPKRFFVSSSTEAWVIVAGWQIKLSTPPRLSASEKYLRDLQNLKVLSLLEGGYDLKALAESANYHVNALIESENK